MYSQLSMVREPATNDCKPQGTHKTLGPHFQNKWVEVDGKRPTERRELRHLSSVSMRYKAGAS
jgi:hypothetical protein